MAGDSKVRSFGCCCCLWLFLSSLFFFWFHWKDLLWGVPRRSSNHWLGLFAHLRKRPWISAISKEREIIVVCFIPDSKEKAYSSANTHLQKGRRRKSMTYKHKSCCGRRPCVVVAGCGGCRCLVSLMNGHNTHGLPYPLHYVRGLYTHIHPRSAKSAPDRVTK